MNTRIVRSTFPKLQRLAYRKLFAATYQQSKMNHQKTAAAVLQELVVKENQQAEYTCISQTGPSHVIRFEYRCLALGATASAIAGSKKEAKQAAAREVLLILATRGHPVPPPFNMPQPMSSTLPEKDGKPIINGAYSYVVLLRELCERYRLPAAEFELIGDAGPPHLRMFTIRGSIGQHERIASGYSKKVARQKAAELLYKYIHETLGHLTHDFDEEAALVRQRERVMERYVETIEDTMWRPDLGQRIADYHLGLITHIEPEKCELARRALEHGPVDAKGDYDEDAESTLMAAVTALGLSITESTMEATEPPDSLTVLELTPTSPTLCFCDVSRSAACRKAVDHLRLALK